nr:hypothetical protein [Tanacetum cinerariifolium]
MVYTGDDEQALFTSHAWRRLFEISVSLVREFMLKFFSTSRMSDTKIGLDVADTLCFQLDGARRRMTWRQFISALGLHTEQEMAEAGFGEYWGFFLLCSHQRPCEETMPQDDSMKYFWWRTEAEKVTGVDLFYLRTMDHGTANVLYLLAQYLSRHAEGKKSGARLSGGHFIGRLAAYFGLAKNLVDVWRYMGLGSPRAREAAGYYGWCLGATEDALVVDKGAQADPTPAPEKVIDVDLFYLRIMDRETANVSHLLAHYLFRHAEGRKSKARLSGGHFIRRLATHFALVSDEGFRGLQAPQQPPPPPLAIVRTIPQRLRRLEEEVQGLHWDVGSLRGPLEILMTDQGRFSTWMISCMAQLMDASGMTY